MDDSLTYKIAGKMIGITQSFSLNLFENIALAYKSTYVHIATIGLILILSKYLFTRQPPIKEMISFMISLVVASAIAFNVDLFKVIIYDTFFDTIYRFDQFVIQSSSLDIKNSSADFRDLSSLFSAVDNAVMGVGAFALEVASENEFGWRTIPIWLEAGVIFLLFLFVITYFLVMFTVSIFGAHMMIILMPITISFYPFKSLRVYSHNCFKEMFYYGIITVFLSIAVSLVISITNDLVIQADKIRADALENEIAVVIPVTFFIGAIIIGFMSIFFLKIAPEFASKVLNSSSSQIGGAFPMAIAGATTLAKGSVTAGKVGASATYKGGRGAVSGLKTAGGGAKSIYNKFFKE